MWTCQKCNRTFEKEKQPHSCRHISVEEHFKNKEKAKELFDYLFKIIIQKVGLCQIISLPCCIHLFGKYDFLAALPKKDKLEIRFSLDRVLNTSRLKQSVPVSLTHYKNCIDISKKEEIDGELIKWIKESYLLKKL